MSLSLMWIERIEVGLAYLAEHRFTVIVDERACPLLVRTYISFNGGHKLERLTGRLNIVCA